MKNLNIKSLRYYRKKCRFTLKQLSTKLGKSPAAIGMYEKGGRTPDMFYLSELATALNLDSSNVF